MAEDEMVRQHHRLNGHESEQTVGDNEEQGRLVCSPWGCRELDTTQQLNNNKEEEEEIHRKSQLSNISCHIFLLRKLILTAKITSLYGI